MKRTGIIFALALVFAVPAFAEDEVQAAASPPTNDAPAVIDTRMDMDTDKASGELPPSAAPACDDNANAAFTGNEPKVVAYQRSGRMKHYPVVDPGHVAGDPPIIDHSSDLAPVPSTTTAITVPPATDRQRHRQESCCQ